MRPHPASARSVLPVLALGLAVVLVAIGGWSGWGAPGSVTARRSPGVPRRTLAALYRPTVTILKGQGRGSGTVIASSPGETLVLTAAHVVAPAGELGIELRPYNLGIEADPRAAAGPWPRRLPAEVAAQDVVGDVAVVRVRARRMLPYVARIAPLAEAPAPSDLVTSVGVDADAPLTGWLTDVQGTARLDIGTGGVSRFLITTRAPDPGRSGGGLFRPDGALVGVCVGRIEPQDDRPARGVFASLESIHALLRAGGLERRSAHPGAGRRLIPPRARVAPLSPDRARR